MCCPTNKKKTLSNKSVRQKLFFKKWREACVILQMDSASFTKVSIIILLENTRLRLQCDFFVEKYIFVEKSVKSLASLLPGFHFRKTTPWHQLALDMGYLHQFLLPLFLAATEVKEWSKLLLQISFFKHILVTRFFVHYESYRFLQKHKKFLLYIILVFFAISHPSFPHSKKSNRRKKIKKTTDMHFSSE